MREKYKDWLDLDINQIEGKPLTSEEKSTIKEYVFSTKMEQRKYNKPFLAVAISLASILVLSFTMSQTNPVLASKLPIVGNIFEFFSNSKDEYVPKEYSHHSTALNLTQSSNGVEVTITDAVYDGESITVAYTMKSDETLGEDPFLDGDFFVEEYVNSYTPGGFITEQISETEYAGLYRHHLMTGKKSDTVHINWNGEQIRRSYDEQPPIEGQWSFEFTLDILEGKTQIFEDVKSENNGILVELNKMTTTPVTSTFYMKRIIDENLKEWDEENWQIVDISYLVKDNLGNKYNIIHQGGYGDSKYSVTQRFSVPIFHEDATSITITPVVEIYKLKENGENGELELAKEPFPIDPIEVQLN